MQYGKLAKPLVGGFLGWRNSSGTLLYWSLSPDDRRTTEIEEGDTFEPRPAPAPKRAMKCPECGSRDGVRLLVDITKTWNGEVWEAGGESESFECFDCDATDIQPEEVEE